MREAAVTGREMNASETIVLFVVVIGAARNASACRIVASDLVVVFISSDRIASPAPWVSLARKLALHTRLRALLSTVLIGRPTRLEVD